MPAGSRGIVTAPSYPMLRDATMRTWLDMARQHGLLQSFRSGDMTAKCRNGLEVMFRSTGDDEGGPDRLRGPNVGWFYADELAMSPHEAWLILIGRLREAPGLGAGTTSPRGFNWLWSLFHDGGQDYEIVTASTRTNQFLPTEYVGSLERSYDDHWRKQEIEGLFVAMTGFSVFDARYLNELLNGGALPAPLSVQQEGEEGLSGRLTLWKEPVRNARYGIGADVALGRRKSRSDSSAFVVLRSDTWEQVGEYEGQCDPKSYAVDLWNVSQWFNNAEINVESNSMGIATILYLSDFGANLWTPPKPVAGERDEDPEPGTVTTTKSKGLADADLRSAIVEAAMGMRSIVLRGRATVEQLIHYVHLPDGGRGGEGTWHDDLVRACALAWSVVKDDGPASEDREEIAEAYLAERALVGAAYGGRWGRGAR